MITTSQEWKDRIYNNRSALLLRAELKLHDGTSLYLDYEDKDDDFLSSGIGFTDETSAENTFSIGSAIMNTFSFKLNNANGKYDATIFQDAEIFPQIGMEIDGSVEWLDKGVYLVADPGSRGSSIAFATFDRMAKMHIPFSGANIVFPITLGALALATCAYCGVELATTEFPNHDYVIESSPIGASYNCRQIISFIAQIAGCYARFNNAGKLEIAWYRETENVVPEYNSLEADLLDTEITGVKVTSYYSDSAHSEDVEGGEITENSMYGEAGYVIAIAENPLIQYGQSEKVAELIGKRIVGTRFRSLNLKTLYDPSLEAGDKISITDVRGNTYVSFITNLSVNFGGYVNISCGAETAEENAVSGNYSGNQAVVEAVAIANAKFKNLITVHLEAEVGKFGYVKADTVSAIVASFEYATIKDLNAAKGRIEDLETNTLKTADLSAAVAKLGYATIDSLDAVTARITTLESTSVKTSDLTAINGNITNLQSQVATIEKAYVNEAKVNDLIAGKGYITSLEADKLITDKGYITSLETKDLLAGYVTTKALEAEQARIETLETNSLTANSAVITKLQADIANTNSLFSNYATIDLANVIDGSITNAMIGKGVVGTAQIADGSITDAKIVELTANKINAGTLSVERLEIRGSETSIVYALNNITNALQSQNVDTLNGEILTPRTITADKIVAESITANEIAANAITANHILAGEITSDKIASSAINAIHIETGTITADKINLTDLFAQQITATNMTIKGTSSFEGDVTANYLKATAVDASGGFSIKDGNTVFATFGANKIELGKNSKNSVIDLCNGTGQISALDGALYGLLDGLHVGSENGLYLFGYETLLGNYYGTKTAVVHTKSLSDGDSTSVVLDAMYQVATNNVPRASVNVYASSADTYVEILATDGTNSSALIVEPTQLLFNGSVVCDASNISEYVALYAEPKGHAHSFLEGTATRPTYNGNDLALYSDITTAATGAYLPLSGGKMTGPISFKDNSALPSATEMKYICGISAFADGGTLQWQNKETFLDGYAKTSDLANYALASALTGYALTGHTHDSVMYQDTRSVNQTPNALSKGISVHLKSNGTDGVSDGGNYHPVLALKPWQDISGGPYGQITTTQNGNLYWRVSTDNNGESWNAWQRAVKATELSNYALASHTHSYLPLSGGTLTGNLTGQYIKGTWLQTTAVTDLGSTPTQIAVLSNGWIYYRTPAEILSDIGAVDLASAQTITGLKTFNAPANVASTEQTTVKFKTSNGGALIIGKEGPNSGTMLRFDQVDGTCRLRFRGSATAGAMVWEQPEQGAQLYVDLGKDGVDKRRITFPASAGTLALTSQIPSLSGYATQSWVTTQISNASISGGSVDLSDYARLSVANIYNGEQKFQNSSYCPTVTDTASGVGCAFKASRGMVNELLVDKLIMTASTGKIPFYKYTGTSGGAMTGLTEVASISSAGVFSGTATKATQDGNGNNIASTYLPLSGGTMTGPLVLTGGDAASGVGNMQLDTNGQITAKGTTSTLFGRNSATSLLVGHSSHSLTIRGSGGAPTYNGQSMDVRKVLYDNSTGTYGTVTLSETAANFSMLEIIVGYSDLYGCQSIKVYSPNSKVVDISSVIPTTGANINAHRTRCTISGTSITQAYNGRTIHYANMTTAGVYAENILYIKTVIGYR